MKRMFAALAGSTVCALLAIQALPISAATLPGKIVVGGQTYYIVNGSDAALDSGDEVCAAVGMTCSGYSNMTNDVCKAAHPGAKVLTSVNGSKNGFYCNGAPQKGLACEKTLNTCVVCPACNLNADCTTAIGTQFREMYVTCKPKAVARSSSSRSRIPLTRRSTYTPPPTDGVDARVGIHRNKKVCEFFNGSVATVSNKKLVTCSAPGAAAGFCKQMMGSPAAIAAKCEENGIIICTLPCNAPNAQSLQRCAADVNRKRGTNAAPISFCTTSSASSIAKGTKKAGDLCSNGGECASTFCLGTGRPNNQPIYQCSCKQNVFDTSCNGASSSSLPATGRKPGQTCDHGGQCASGKCIGTVPGQLYQCSCSWDKVTYGC